MCAGVPVAVNGPQRGHLCTSASRENTVSMGASMWRVTVARAGAVRVWWAVVSIGTSGAGAGGGSVGAGDAEVRGADGAQLAVGDLTSGSAEGQKGAGCGAALAPRKRSG